jgi:hypothetical protein
MSAIQIWRAATATISGIVTTAAQTFAGVKTFNSGIVPGSGQSTLANYTAWTSFSPEVRVGGAQLTLTTHYTLTAVKYTRIGGLVVYKGRIIFVGFGGNTGALTISLPVTAAEASSEFTRAFGVHYVAGDAKYYQISATFGSTTSAAIWTSRSGNGASANIIALGTSSGLDASAELYFTLMYEA